MEDLFRIGTRKRVGIAVLAIWSITIVAMFTFGVVGYVVLASALLLGVVAAGTAQATVLAARNRGELISAKFERASTERRMEELVSAARKNPERTARQLAAGNEAILAELKVLKATEDATVLEMRKVRSRVEWFEEVLTGIAGNLERLSRDVEQSLVCALETDKKSVERRDERLTTDHFDTLTALAGNTRPTLIAAPQRAPETTAARRVNWMLESSGSAAYLEVGLAAGKTFQAVRAIHRLGIDPTPSFDTANLPVGVQVFSGTSDAFFEWLASSATFNVAYIDGLHTLEQTYRDLLSVLAHLVEDGSILMDDVVPRDDISAIESQSLSLDTRRYEGLSGTPWHGDVFRIVSLLCDHHPELEYRTIVGSGNEQLLVWKADSTKRSRQVDGDVLRSYKAQEYVATFENGIPGYFRPVNEQQAMIDLRAHMAQRRADRNG